jgi:transcriptional regulator with XRE-family HTH domain
MTIPSDPADQDQFPSASGDAAPDRSLEPSIYPGPSRRPPPNPARNRRKDTREKAREIGTNIRTIRMNRNMMQQDLIDLLGHGTTTWLSRIENGHQLITFTILEEIADALGVSLDDLRSRTPIMRAPAPQLYGPRLRALRKQRGLSQTQVTARLGHGDAKWLSGVETSQRSTRPPNLAKLAQIFDVSVADLLAETSPLDQLVADPPAEPT